MKTNSLIIILTIIAQFSFAQEFTDLYGNYLGQIPPGDTAIVFAPGIISLPDRQENKIVFSPDGKECFFGISIRAERALKTYYTKCVNNVWTKPGKVPFLDNLHNSPVPLFSVDGNRLYTTSNSGIDRDIFMFERIPGGWGESQRLPSPINSDFNDKHYTETADGIVYIISTRPGGFGETARKIWRIKPSSETAESLGADINAGSYISSPCVAPDGSFLIFGTMGRSGMIGRQDLFICFNQGNNNWSEPINMEESGAGINIGNNHTQNSPSLSPDGKYLFFRRHNYAGNISDIYWVSAKIIDKLREENLNNY